MCVEVMWVTSRTVPIKSFPRTLCFFYQLDTIKNEALGKGLANFGKDPENNYLDFTKPYKASVSYSALLFIYF